MFSNAALHWVPTTPRCFARLTAALAPGGQLAVQVPANHDHPSHLVAERSPAKQPFREALGGYAAARPCSHRRLYAELLHRLGYGSQHVRLQVYLHVLPEPAAVVEWVKGTLLTDYRRRLPEEAYDEFLARYRAMLISELPEQRPYPFTFKRILLWGRVGRDA